LHRSDYWCISSSGRAVALRYTQALISQMAQELIANMLGVRCAESAFKLQHAGPKNHKGAQEPLYDFCE
jgi:hypothetical protein